MSKDLFVLPEEPCNEYFSPEYYHGEFAHWYAVHGLPREVRAGLEKLVKGWPFSLAQSLIVDVAYSVWSAQLQEPVDDLIFPGQDRGEYWTGYREAVEKVLDYLAPSLENGSPALGRALKNLDIAGTPIAENLHPDYALHVAPSFFVSALDELWRYAKDGEEHTSQVNFKRKPFGCVEFVAGGNTALPPSVETLLAYDLELRFRVYTARLANTANFTEEPVGTVVTYGMTMPSDGRPCRGLVSLIINDCLSDEGGWNADRVKDRLRDFTDKVIWYPWPTMRRPLGMLGRKGNWFYEPRGTGLSDAQREIGGISAFKLKITPPRNQ
ncbi:hypothetical protein [Alcanivorax sp.]|uniref:hypothetical protein n=1 Tax=Alcanivorax sp. TaxID=1872427 RepID=UPI000C0D5E60|nr:hypothetical protein [Alcanivorax sp.]PHR65095.1 MAG: hypothetical protein COA55_12185 [Alcanivorax sp.]